MNPDALKICEYEILPGEIQDIGIKITESYLGNPITLPIRVYRAEKPGPHVFVTAAIHGDEINGTGILRSLMLRPMPLIRGTLIFCPIINIFGFENHSRYLPDRRDLNRCFPGNDSGSFSDRLAAAIFKHIVSICDVGIDLHSAAIRRTNFPHVRADLEIEGIKDIAKTFGCEVIMNGKGPNNSLRQTANKSGCLTIMYEAGEVFKFEPRAIQIGVRGIKNVLIRLGMLEGEILKPLYQEVISDTAWLRADVGGILQFHVHPGDLIEKGQPIVRCEKLFSSEAQIIYSPYYGIILGMTSLPAVKPGEAICHIAEISRKSFKHIQLKLEKSSKTEHKTVRRDFASDFLIVSPEKQ